MRLTTCLIVLSLSSPAFAADWYVDAVNGSNANSGTSPAAAWKTITWAVAHSPQSGAQFVHVAPGLYDVALGESFPIVMRPDLRIFGDQGSALTIVAASGSGALFSLSSMSSGNGWAIGNSTRLVGLKLRNAGSGVSIYSDWNGVSPLLVDLVIEQMSIAGVEIFAGAYPCCGATTAYLERVRVTACARGVKASGEFVKPTMVECDFSNNIGPGFEVATGGSVELTLNRCRIDGNGGDGFALTVYNYGWLTGILSDCSISDNAGQGWNAPVISSLHSARNARFTRCTVAGNAVGMSAYRNPGAGISDTVELRDCIFYGNGDDLAFTFSVPYVPVVEGCDIGDGDYAGTNGNFSADPLFVNAAAADWRLQFGSPCADIALNVPPAGTLDLLGHARAVDGNLDTLERSDIGAFEHRPLELVSTAQLGSLVQWELWGPQGAPATLYWTRVAVAGSPTATPFGELDLVPSAAHVYRVMTAGASAPTVLQRSIPNAALLVGETFAFQALTDSAAAPNGKAYSNPVQFTVIP